MEAICELPEITALQRYHGNSCNWAGSWGGFTEQTFGTVLFCPDISNLLDIGKRSILKKEAVPLYTETNDLGSRKSMDVEMREPWSMKQAHKNVAYKWNRTERSLISKINNGIELNDLSSWKSIKVEMREPWAMKQAHKNVAYKWNRSERSLFLEINKSWDARAMSNEART